MCRTRRCCSCCCRSRASFRLVLLVLLVLTLAPGCDSGQDRTVQGTNERNKHLEKRNAELERELARLKQESEASRSSSNADFESRLTKLQELHRRQVAELEGSVASLRLELGARQREQLVLEEVHERRPRLAEAVKGRFGIERTVWMVLLFAALVMLAWVALRLTVLRREVGNLVVRRAAV